MAFFESDEYSLLSHCLTSNTGHQRGSKQAVEANGGPKLVNQK